MKLWFSPSIERLRVKNGFWRYLAAVRNGRWRALDVPSTALTAYYRLDYCLKPESTDMYLSMTEITLT